MAFATGLAIYIISSVFYKKQVFGFGDVKLIAVIGYLGGIQYFLFIFVGVTILATVFALTGILLGRYNWQSKIPLGTFLCTGGVLLKSYRKKPTVY